MFAEVLSGSTYPPSVALRAASNESRFAAAALRVWAVCGLMLVVTLFAAPLYATGFTPGASMATARYLHTATLLPSGKVLAAGGFNSSGTLASAELYDPATNRWSAAGALATARGVHTATLLPSGKVLVAGGTNGGSLASAELYDPATNSWSAAGALTSARLSHTATLLPSGKVLVAGGYNGGDLASAELYNPATNSWSAAGALATARQRHTATLRPSGFVLVAGGEGASGSLASAELYDPATNSWGAVGALATARGQHTATLLPSGQVLAAGGGNSGGFLASAELYDPPWSAGGALATPRGQHTATLLPSGQVLVAGGRGNSGYLASTELYDPATTSWSAAGALAAACYQHTATLLPSGKLLVAGGTNGGSLASTELYDPATNSWSAAGALATARQGHIATLLPSGKLLVAGGYNSSGTLASTELYDPATNSWSAAGALASVREQHTATLLPSGKVVVAGGYGNSGTLASAELYDPATNTWSAAGALATARANHTATLLPSGQLLVAGGYNNVSGYLASAELYDPATNSWNAAGVLATAREQHTATLLPSGKLLVAGGFNSSGALAAAELFEPGLSPVSSLQPILSAANNFLLQTSKLAASSTGSSSNPATGAVTATGFVPRLQASGGGTNNSATNMPVFQVQRLDNEQMRFIANDETVNLSDTAFTGSASALAGFPAGPVRVRVWVNGVPSAARYSRLAVSPGAPTLAPTAIGGVLQATVNFTASSYDGGAPITSYTAMASPGGASASCTAPCTSISFNPIAAGTYTFAIVATNAAGSGSPSASSNSVIVQAASTTNLVSSANPSTFGQSVNFTATVSGQSPTGTVTFNDGATAICSGVGLSSGSATCPTAALTVGPHSITAVYSGDVNNTGSTSNIVAQQIDQAATASTTSLVSATNPSTFSQSVTFTATVTGQSPSGTVTFNDGATAICSAVPLSSGSAAGCTTSALTVGSHSMTAVYSGDTNNATSTSNTVTQLVNKVASTTSLATSCMMTFVGNQPFTMTASVSGAAPTGSVNFATQANIVVCGNVPLSSGSASCTTNALSVVGPGTEQSYSLTAIYAGDVDNAPSGSSAIVVTALNASDVVFRNGLELELASCPIE